MSSDKKIKNLEKERAEILRCLLDFKMMIPGSFGELILKCGKKNCWCHQKKDGGHPLSRITWTENGVAKTKAIPKEDIEWIKEMTDSYRAFRQLRRKLKNLETTCKQTIDKYEREVVKNTRKLRDYL